MPVTEYYTLEQYIAFYQKNNRLFDNQYTNPEKTLNFQQLKSKYEKYIRRSEKKKLKVNTQYAQSIYDVEKECRDKDPAANEFWNALTSEETDFLMKEMKKILAFRDIDPAHILPRGVYPHLSTEPLNIIMVPRVFHTFIDGFLNPFTTKHEAITKEKQEQIWRHIVGDSRYDKLLELARGGN